MTNKEKFLALVSKEKTNTLEINKERIKSRPMLRESRKIAIKVMKRLDELGWSQKDLAEALKVSPQQVSKIVSGKENLTIETQIKLQETLNIPILASFYETKIEVLEQILIFNYLEIKQLRSILLYQYQTKNSKLFGVFCLITRLTFINI